MSTDRPRPERRRDVLFEAARNEGFDRMGVATPEPSEHEAFLRDWLREGYHGQMDYLARSDALERRGDPALSLDPLRSILVVGHDYDQPDPDGVPDDPSCGVIARYARGRDYHKVVRKKLQRVLRRLEADEGRSIGGRVYVDTGPLLERELGQRAGLGWFGRNTMLIDPKGGSYFFLAALLLPVDVTPDPPFTADRCGSCRACLDACPTGALLGRDEDGAPVMDARLCISYLTIENRGPIPRELRPLMGNRVYGCDICQEVCPFSLKFAEEAAEPGYAARGPGERPVGVEALPGEGDSGSTEAGSDHLASTDLHSTDSAESRGRSDGHTGPSPTRPPKHPGTDGPPLTELLRTALSEEAWDAFSRGSAIRRAGRAGFVRNVCVAIGNWLGESDDPDPVAVRLLERALSDPEPLVRGHAAWALGQAGTPEAREAMRSRLASEETPWVRDEIAMGPGP